eukprot:365274-Chlamydomonas_euryale.AAC.3
MLCMADAHAAYGLMLCMADAHAQVSQHDINKAFLALGANPNNTRIGREALLNVLQQACSCWAPLPVTRSLPCHSLSLPVTLLPVTHSLPGRAQDGEPMTAQELLHALHQLTGATKISDAVPHNIDAKKFASEVLGFEDDGLATAGTQAA